MGGVDSHAAAINARGQVVGYSDTATAGVWHAFLYYRGTMTDLGTVEGGRSYATDINARGEVAGYSARDTTTARAFRLEKGWLANLGAGIDGSSFAYGINDAGEVLGEVHNAVLWVGGAMTDLGTLGGFLSMHGPSTMPARSWATAIGRRSCPCISLGGRQHDRPRHLGGDWSNGSDLNDAGVVVGGSGIAGSVTGHAFRWANGGMSDLGTLGGASSFAFAINGSGQIVGRFHGR